MIYSFHLLSDSGFCPDCECADANEAAAPLPLSGEEDESREGVITGMRLQQMDRWRRVLREDGWINYPERENALNIFSNITHT